MTNINSFLTSEGAERVSKFLPKLPLLSVSNIKSRLVAGDSAEVALIVLLPKISTPRSLSFLTSEKEIVKNLTEVNFIFEKLSAEVREEIIIQILKCHKNYLKLLVI